MKKRIARALVGLAVLAGAYGGAAAKADAYLHVKNAADYCRVLNYPAANSIMKASVGYGVWQYSYGGGPFDPYDYHRWSSSDVNVDIIYTNKGTNPALWGVMYGCEIRGSDSGMYSVQLWQATSVYWL